MCNLNNRIRPAPADLTWTQHVELLPVTNKADKRRLERRIISDKVSPRQIRLEVRQLKESEQAPAQDKGPARKQRLPWYNPRRIKGVRYIF